MTTPRSSNRNTMWKLLTPIVVIIAFILGVLFFIKTELSQAPKTGTYSSREIGAVLPEFSLTQVNGNTVQLPDLKSKVILINFWASWCEACIEEMPSIVKLRDAYKSRGFEVAGINLDENPETVVPKMINRFQMSFPIFKDLDGKLGDLLDVHAIPFTVVINNQRKVLYAKDGEYDWNSQSFRSKLEQWLGE